MRDETAPSIRIEIGFLLWLGRHLSRSSGDDGLLERELVCCFGSNLAFAARTAAEGLRPAIMRLQPRLTGKAGSQPTYPEQIMLSVYQSLRSGMEDEALETAAELFGERTGRRFVEHAGCLAKLFALREAGANAARLARIRKITADRALPPATAAWQLPAAAQQSGDALSRLALKQERAPAEPETGNRRRPH